MRSESSMLADFSSGLDILAVASQNNVKDGTGNQAHAVGSLAGPVPVGLMMAPPAVATKRGSAGAPRYGGHASEMQASAGPATLAEPSPAAGTAEALLHGATQESTGFSPKYATAPHPPTLHNQTARAALLRVTPPLRDPRAFIYLLTRWPPRCSHGLSQFECRRSIAGQADQPLALSVRIL